MSERLNDNKYFPDLAIELRRALRVHRDVGLWERNDKGERDWGNVTEHCLVVAARVDTLLGKLGVSDEMRRSAKIASGLHDFSKKYEKGTLRPGESVTWESYDDVEAWADTKLRKEGFSKRVIRLAGAPGHTTFDDVLRILEKKHINQEDTAFLAIHYIDLITRGSEWIEPAEYNPYLGRKINDLDRRVQKNISNQSLVKVNQAGLSRFGGLTTYQVQAAVGYKVQDRLSSMLEKSTGNKIDPISLPEQVDNWLKEEMLTK